MLRFNWLHKTLGHLTLVSILMVAAISAAVLFFADLKAEKASPVSSPAVEFSSSQYPLPELSGHLPENRSIASLDELRRNLPVNDGFRNPGENLENTNGVQDPLEITILDVPFTPQAPYGEWQDPRQDYGCEEASMLMVWYYLNDLALSPAEAKVGIIQISKWELENIGDFHDSSAADTAERFRQYFGYSLVRVKYDIALADIKAELSAGRPVIVPVNGRQLANPYFTLPGPLHHMIVVIGYDDEKKEFITNDPGTKRGAGFRYSYDNLMSALRDYPTGLNKEPAETVRAMMVIEK